MPIIQGLLAFIATLFIAAFLHLAAAKVEEKIPFNFTNYTTTMWVFFVLWYVAFLLLGLELCIEITNRVR